MKFKQDAKFLYNKLLNAHSGDSRTSQAIIEKTDRLIIDIALECGFSSHSHLSKQLRQITGITPKAYRLR